MNLTKHLVKGLLLIVMCLVAPSVVQAQTIKFSQKEMTLKAVFAAIEAQSGLSVDYDASIIDVNTVVQTMDINGDAKTAINSMLKGTGYTCEVRDQHIIVRKTTQESSPQPSNMVRGRILDDGGQPIIGASIRIPETTTGTISDLDGYFSLDVPQGTPLEISSIGFGTQIVTAGNNMVVSLSEDAELLDDVVVIGYGSVRKKDLTGSVAQIKPESLANEAPKTVQDVLRSTAGLNIGLNNSAKGGGSMSLRGQRSVYTSGDHNAPLIILDGMMFYGELSEINPNDIAQIDVLKDASSAAVYGAKSANGVVIITTKKGTLGKPSINFSANVGFATIGDSRTVFDSEGYLQYYQDFYETDTYGYNAATGKYEAYGNGSKPVGYFARPENLSKYGISKETWQGYTVNDLGISDREIWGKRLGLDASDRTMANFLDNKSFDWYDNSFRVGVNQDYNVSVSGATDRANYYLSLGSLSNQSVVKGDDYNSIRANMKISSDITKWLNVNANVNFQDRSDGTIECNWSTAILDNSPFASPYDADGNLTPHPMGNMSYTKGYNYDFDKQYRLLDSGYTVLNSILGAKVTLPLGITYTFSASPRYQFFYNRRFWSSEHPDWSAETNQRVTRASNKRFDWSLNNTISWDYYWDAAKKHHTTLTLVQEAEERQYWSESISAKNIIPSEALTYHQISNADKTLSSFSSNDEKESALGYLARLFYSYDDRYMFTGSFRRDGYSAFGTSNPYANFLSFAFAWTFTNEAFFDWEPLSLGKLRLSYGQNGNRSLENSYIALANLTMGSVKQGYIDSNNSVVDMNYLFVDRLANPKLQWEKSTSFNVGLDLGFFNNRITTSMEYYFMPTTDMIMRQSLPSFTGFTSITTNLGRVDNQGFELTLNSQNISRQNFEWSSVLTFSFNDNKIKSLYGEYETVINPDGTTVTKEKDDISNKWFIGENINSIWNYEVTGIWQADEYEEAAKYGQKPGDPKVKNSYTADDVNGSPVYNNNDKKILGKTVAPVRWSLRNEFRIHKDWTFSFSMYSLMGHKSQDSNYLNNDNSASEVTSCRNKYYKEYWTPENPTNTYARICAKGPTGIEAPPRIVDRSFIRLENISASYQVPNRLIEKVNIQQARLFFTIRNVASWASEWVYGDPEASNGLISRTYSVGLNLTL